MSDGTDAITPPDKHARYNRSEKGHARMRRYFATSKGDRARFYAHLRELAATHKAQEEGLA